MDVKIRTARDTINLQDLDRRSFKLVSNTGEEYDLLTQASVVLDDSTEHFLYDVSGLGYSINLETNTIGDDLVLTNYSWNNQQISGTIMFDSYTTYYEYLAFLYEHQDLEECVYDTPNMLNLEYATVSNNGVTVKNQIKIVASDAEVSEKSSDGLLYVPIKYISFSKTNRQINIINTGKISFTDCEENQVFPLPSVLNGVTQDYIALPDDLCDLVRININNPTRSDLKIKIKFIGNVINPRYFFEDDNNQKGGVDVIGDDNYNIIIDGDAKKAYNENGEDLSSTLQKNKENYITLKPGDNPMAFILQDGNPNGLDCQIIIDVIVEN